MNTLENQNDTLPPQGDSSQNTDERLNFLNNTEFADIKEPLSKTITDLAKEQIVPEQDFWGNIEQITKDIFSDELYNFDPEQKKIDAQNIFLFRTKFEEIKKENEKKAIEKAKKEEIIISNQKEETNSQKEETNSQKEIYRDQLRSNLETKYTQIDEKYKTTTDSKEFKQLKESDPNVPLIPEEKRDLYVSYLYATNKIIAEANENKNQISQKNYEYIQQFNTLNVEFGIQEIDLAGFDIIEDKDAYNPNNGNTEGSMNDITYDKDLAKNLADNNADVEEFIADTETDVFKENDEASKLSKTALTEKLGNRYEKDIKEDLSKLLKKNKIGADEEVTYEACFNTNGTLKTLPEEFQQYEEQLTTISETIVNKYAAKAQQELVPTTNKVIKSKAVAALIQNIGKFLNVQDVEKQFMIDIADGIEMDGNMLTLGGTMEDRDLKFYYDITTGEVRADDFVHYNKEDETFYLDKGKNEKQGRERLPLKMPNLNDAMTASQTAVEGKIDQFLESNNDLKSYETTLNEAVVDVSKDSAVADIVIKHTMAKNIALQDTQEFLEDYLPSRKQYSRDQRPKEYNLYYIMDTSFDRYTTEEIERWKNLLGRFNEKISAERPGYEDEMIQSMFDENIIQSEVEDRYDIEKGPKMYQFIQALTYNQPGTIKNDVIDLDLFEDIVESLEKNDGTTKNLAEIHPKYEKLRNTYKEEQDKDGVDNIIDNNADARENVA